MVHEKQHAHELIDRLPPNEVPTAVTFLQFLLTDRLSRKLASAPVSDEEETEEERRAVQEAKDWLAQHGGKGIPHEEVLAEFGLTADFGEHDKLVKGPRSWYR
jgi:hypothetical protein